MAAFRNINVFYLINNNNNDTDNNNIIMIVPPFKLTMFLTFCSKPTEFLLLGVFKFYIL